MGFEKDIGWWSRGGDWRGEREGEVREKMNGGVAAGGYWRREIEGEGQERMEGGRQRLEVWYKGRDARDNGGRSHGG
ncbi:hypothetical protein TIFTF001_032539 [Ficus carica]|uniref:Uncharacterized protein n=1 Tax=Ficus carica TaxID=3494 RepID=A0AA88DYM5_FICCA|nr:hypothetical protein TIFTF001_032539 [Ficus carica]